MTIEEVVKAVGVPSAILTVVITWYNFVRDRQKGSLELNKNRLELLDELEKEIESGSTRKIEMAFLAIVGVTTNGNIIKKLWSTQASINQLSYLARASNEYLTVKEQKIQLRSRTFDWMLLLRVILTVGILALYVAVSATANDIGFKTSPTIFIMMAILIVSAAIAALNVVSIDKMCDAAALAGYRSRWKWVNTLIDWRQLHI